MAVYATVTQISARLAAVEANLQEALRLEALLEGAYQEINSGQR
jgi:hypothetical protein